MSIQLPDNVYMIDIETQGIKPGCIVGSIGAVHLRTGAFLYQRLNIYAQPQGTQDGNTMRWWQQQSPELFAEAFHGSEDPVYALSDLSRFLTLSGAPVIWAKGIDFDPPILADLYNRLHLPVPWAYNAVRDFRTVKKIFSYVGTPRSATELHNALYDAQHQAEELANLALAYNLKLD